MSGRIEPRTLKGFRDYLPEMMIPRERLLEAARGVYHLGEGITGKVVETGETIVVPRISEEPNFLNRTGARGDQTDKKLSFLCVPIKRGKKVLGTISAERIYDNSRLLKLDVEVLSILASTTAQAVELYLIEIGRAHV